MVSLTWCHSHASIPHMEHVPRAMDPEPTILDRVPLSLEGCFTHSSIYKSYGQLNIPYSHCLQEWLEYIKYCSNKPKVPHAATHITIPLNPFVWQCLLSRYPDQQMVHFFVQGIQMGFQIGVVDVDSNFKSAKNMHSDIEHVHVVQKYLSTEIQNINWQTRSHAA